MILPTLLPWVMAALTLALALNGWRLFKGPALADRILALDTLYVNALALVVVVGIWQGSKLYFELAVLVGLLGFIGTVALAKYLVRGDIVE
jgi:multicomponent K+:H+ antiporter subunit F